ncbi:hypothetical protein HD806DRAFT_541730 [Xylariaceae sp. AK1471]|nr:hypothetical protein HD806DRAFT_541730 [Xylariaceae sp. AK1471]
MEVLLRLYKGHDKEIVPTWFPFAEENIPLLCPHPHLLAKALAEGVIDKPSLDMRLSTSSIRRSIYAQSMYPGISRSGTNLYSGKSSNRSNGPRKSDEPITQKQFDNNTNNLGRNWGRLDTQSYGYRRGQLQSIDRATPFPQDAFLSRDTTSPYLDILNHTDSQYDENAPKEVLDELMRAISPDDATLRIRAQLAALPHEMRDSFGRQRRKVLDIIHKEHFAKKNENEFENQLRGIQVPEQPLQRIICILPKSPNPWALKHSRQSL